MAQICSLQGEIQLLAQAQAATTDLIQQKDTALQRERTIKEGLLQKYKVCTTIQHFYHTPYTYLFNEFI